VRAAGLRVQPARAAQPRSVGPRRRRVNVTHARRSRDAA
jgi:hypothetical protein